MNIEICFDILRRLGDAVRRKRPEKWRNNSWFLLRDSAAAHRLGLVRDFLAKSNVSTQQHPPYYPDLASADSYLFCRLTSALKGRRFCDATDIFKNAAEEHVRLSGRSCLLMSVCYYISFFGSTRAMKEHRSY